MQAIKRGLLRAGRSLHAHPHAPHRVLRPRS